MTAFFCKHCNYKTDRLNNWNKHLNTIKHLNNTEDKCLKNRKGNYVCDVCKKEYKYMNGLHKHKRIHENNLVKAEESQQIQNLYALLEKSISQNAETLEKLLPKVGNNNVTNNINNDMTINVFLNDYCKDAMNINEFIKNINLSIEDINFVSKNGHVSGISNIFVKSLSQLPAYERPIHCYDRKNLQFYVKNDNMWKEDHQNEKIHKGINDISMKQTKAIKMWEKQHPNWMDDKDLTREYMHIVREIAKYDNDEKDLEHICTTISERTDWRKDVNDNNLIKQ